MDQTTDTIETKSQNTIEQPILKARDTSIDVLKGLAMLLVVLAHLIIYIWKGDGLGSTILFNFCSSFQVKLFFFIGGFLLGNKTYEQLTFKYIGKKSLRLLVPYFIWTLLLILVFAYKPLQSLFITPVYGFLLTLWFLNVLLFIAIKTKHPFIASPVLFLLSVALYVVTKHPNFKEVVIHYPVFLLGFAFCKYKIFENKKFQRFQLICCFLYPLSFIFYTHSKTAETAALLLKFLHLENAPKLIVLGTKAAIVVYNHYIVSFFAICAFWYLTNKVKEHNLFKYGYNFFRIMGVYSIQIFLLHSFTFNVDQKYFNGYHNIWETLTVLILSICVPIIIGWLVKKQNQLNTILFGA